MSIGVLKKPIFLGEMKFSEKFAATNSETKWWSTCHDDDDADDDADDNDDGDDE